MDIMDSLQVVSDVTVWVWIHSLYLVLFVSGYVRKRPGEASSIPQAALSMPRALTGKGAIPWTRGCWNVLVAVSVVLQNSVPTSKRFLILYLNSH